MYSMKLLGRGQEGGGENRGGSWTLDDVYSCLTVFAFKCNVSCIQLSQGLN